MFSVVIARPAQTTVAAGPYRSRDFAGLVAHDLRTALAGEYATVDVTPHDDDLLHIPGDPQVLPHLLAAIDGQPVHNGVALMLATAYEQHAAQLRNAA